MQTFFSRSPWERPSVLPLRKASLGQASPNCEPTPEGGQRCADGKYYPPGCAPGTGSGIPAAAPTPGASVPLIVAGVAAAAAAGYALMAGHRHQIGVEPAFESAYPEAVSQLNSIADKINTERANDAFYFSKYIDASKRRLDLVVAEGNAEKVLAQQELIWNSNHRNPDEYKAAQVALDQIVADKNAATQEMEENRAGINTAAQNVMTYRNNAEAIISQLPAEAQSTAWRLIDPCSFKKTSMEGRRLGQYNWNNAGGASGGGGMYSWNGYGMNPEQRLLQNAQQSMNTPLEPTPEQRLLQQSQASAGGDCYTCANGGDIKSGVDAATAANLRAQGYRCRKDECAQQSGSFGNFGNFENVYGSSQAPVTSTAVNPGGFGGSSSTTMIGRRYPVVNR